MSNSYDHTIKMNMLDSVYGSKEKLKKDLTLKREELQQWYLEEQKKYDRALENFDDWYCEYAGAPWEENNDMPEGGKTYALTGGRDQPSIARGDSWKNCVVEDEK